MNAMCLLIDDNPIDLLINEKVLKTLNNSITVVSKSSALEALEFLKNSKEGFPQMMLVDIKMPMMDGFEFIEACKKLNSKELSHTKIYMVSSSIDPVDVKRARSNRRIEGFLVKPLTVGKVRENISLTGNRFL